MASSALATAFVNIVPGTVAVENYLKTQLGGQVAAAGDAAGGQMAGGLATGFGSKLKSYIGPMVAGMAATFALVNVKNFLGDAITNASSLNEAGTATIQIFGDASTEISKFASGAVNIGLSSIAATDAAKTFGIFGKSAGLAGQANVDFSTKLTTLAADLASFNNSTPEEAILALGAGLRGEAEPLRRFGVLLDDFTLRQKAVELGLTKTTKEALTPQMKVLASYGVIMDQTSVQQGDFARTSDGLANQQRILDAQMENLKTNIGQGLLPVMTDLAHFANDVLVPAFTNLTNFFKDYGPVIGAFAGTVTLLSIALNAQAIATAISTSSIWLFTAALLANPLTWIVLGVAALVAGIVLLATKTTFFQDAWTAMTKWVTEAWNNVVKWFGEAWKNISKFFQDALNFIVRIFMDWSIYGLIIKFVAWIGQNWQKIGQFFVQVWNNIVSFFSTIWNNIVSFVSTGITNIVKFFTELPGKILKAISGFANMLFNFGKNIVQGLINGAGSLLKNVGKFFLDMLPGWIVAPFKAALGIKSPSKVFREFGKNILEGLIEGLTSDEAGVKATMEKVASWVDDALWNKDISKKSANAANSLIKVYSTQLQGLAKEHDAIVAKLEKAQDDLADRLQEKADFLKSISEKFGAGYTIDEKTTAADAIKQLQDRVAKAKELAVVSAKLQQMGLNKDLYRQIVEAGAVDFAKSIIEGGQGAVDALNVLANEANAQAVALATQVGGVLFDQGIAFAQSVVDGLVSQEATLSAVMARVADEFASRIAAIISAGAAQAAAEQKVADAKVAAKTAQAAYDAAVKKSGKNSTAAKNALAKLNTAKTAVSSANKQLNGIVIPAFANGGFVTKPTLGLIGEAGPEVVTPLKDFQAMVAGSNSPTIVYNAAPNQSIDAEQALFQAIRRAKVVAAW
jgi:hypothetical protein